MRNRLLFWLGCLAAVILFLYGVRDILFPFIIAIFLSYLLDPAVDKLESKGLSRAMSTILVSCFFFAVMLFACLLVVPVVYSQVVNLVQKLPDYKKIAQVVIIPNLSAAINRIDPSLVDQFQKAIQDFSGTFFTYIATVINSIWRSGMAFVNLLSLIFITPVITYYLLRDWDVVLEKIEDWLPPRYRTQIRRILSAIDTKLSGYLRGQVNVCLVMALYYTIALSLVGLDFSLFVGVVTGILIVLPYIGVAIGATASLLIALLQAMDGAHIIAVITIFILGHLYESNILTPKLVGDRIGMHPLWMIFAMMSGAAIAGVTGMFLAVPIAAILGIFIRMLLAQYLTSNFYNKKVK